MELNTSLIQLEINILSNSIAFFFVVDVFVFYTKKISAAINQCLVFSFEKKSETKRETFVF